MIDLTREPIDNFIDLLTSKNPQVPAITADDIAIRRLSLFTPDKWPNPKKTGTYLVDPYGQRPYLSPSTNWPKDNSAFIIHKRITFVGGDVTVAVRADNEFKVYIDRVLVSEGADYLNTISSVVSVDAGEHEVLIWCRNGTGGSGIAAVLDDGGVIHAADELTWTCADIGQDTIAHWLQPNGESTVEVDLLIQPSEVVGDYVKFNYERITMDNLFGGADIASNKGGVQIPYRISDVDMLLGSIDNFKDIFNTWYRFSHNGTYTYPANASELNGWQYIEDYDCIESTINSSTYIGFISDELVGDYDFNTVISSNNSDDDTISVILAAFKQGDIDEHEHTLEVVMTRGGLNGSFVRINSNYAHVDSSVLRVLDANTTTPNSGNPWRSWYGHIVGKRIGDKIYVWCKQSELPAPEAGQTRDEMIKVLVDDLARWDETDFTANSYLTAVIDLSTEVTKFNRTTRYGYGQQSQAGSRFWNIHRPNENPTVTTSLKDHFLTRYGVNVGDSGIDVANLGANEYSVTMDNILYHGTLEMLPQYFIATPASLIADGYRFSHGAGSAQPYASGDLTKWTHNTVDDVLEYTLTQNYAGIVTADKHENYVFDTAVSSTGIQARGIYVVAAFAVDGSGVEHTLSFVADAPESPTYGEWAVVVDLGQTTQNYLVKQAVGPTTYLWSDVTERHMRVERVGDMIVFTGKNLEGEPGTNWRYVLDLDSAPELAVFKGAVQFGYGSYAQENCTWRNIPV